MFSIISEIAFFCLSRHEVSLARNGIKMNINTLSVIIVSWSSIELANGGNLSRGI
jgi:hypothetical protein